MRSTVLAAWLAWALPTAFSQTITGSISGSVQDSARAAVSGAEVVVVHRGTGAERRAATSESGDFIFNNAS